jgi:hypothetical protein
VGVLVSTLVAMVVNLGEFTDPLLRGVGTVLLLLGIGVLVECVLAWRRLRRSPARGEPGRASGPP